MDYSFFAIIAINKVCHLTDKKDKMKLYARERGFFKLTLYTTLRLFSKLSIFSKTGAHKSIKKVPQVPEVLRKTTKRELLSGS